MESEAQWDTDLRSPYGRGMQTIEIRALVVRYAPLRIVDRNRASRLAAALARDSQQTPVLVVGDGVLVDGFNRIIDAILLAEHGALCLELERHCASDQRSPLRTCFLALLYNDSDAAETFTALEEALALPPWCCQVSRADQRVLDGPLWANVAAPMAAAHFFLADLSNLNPNVLIEVGRMEALSRPLLLQREGSPDPPADLRGHLCLRLPPLPRPSRSPAAPEDPAPTAPAQQALSPHLLAATGCTPGDAARLAPTVEAFLEADPAARAAQAGLWPKRVEALREELEALLAREAP